MLYNIFVLPLVIIFKYIYLAIYNFTGNLGFSLIIFSIVTRILLRPFSSWASRIQDKERRIQNILSPQIIEIKNLYHGAEQNDEIRELYRRYAYNPLYALRSGLDLFVQMLPLMAAYIMLSELEIIKGIPFPSLGIKDLSRPDSLAWGFNLLPFVMTAFNMLAAVTTKKFTRRERVQAFLIALLFLVMLYNAPSALLVYWTMNNFIMLVKNINFSGLIHSGRISGIMNQKFAPSARAANIFTSIISILLISCFLMYVFFNYRSKYYSDLNTINTLHDIYLFAFVPCVILAWSLYTKFIAGGFTLRECVIKTLGFIAANIIVLVYIKLFMFPNQVFIHSTLFIAILMLYTLSAFLLPVRLEKLYSYSERLTLGLHDSLFFSSVIFALIFVCVLYPSLLYLSDPEFFLDSFTGSITSVSVYGMTLLFALILLWPLLPELFKNFFAFTAAFFVCMAFVNSFILTESYGQINALQIDTRMMSGLRPVLKDIASLLITSGIIIFCVWKKHIKHLITSFVLISFAMLGVSAYCYFNLEHDNNISDSRTAIETEPEFPEYHNRLWRFSRTGKNVICFFLDAFTGDHVIRILQEYPELKKELEGFVYFPDTLAAGSFTSHSTPALYAGAKYTPYVLNKTRPDEELKKKYAEAFSFLPDVFSNKGYDSILIGTPFRADEAIYKSRIRHTESVMTLWGSDWQRDYLPNWFKWAESNGIHVKVGKEDISKFLLVLSLFRTAPFTTRAKIYNNGFWISSVSEEVMKMDISKSFLPNIASLQFMKYFIHVDNGKSTFKFIYNMLTHALWYMQKDSLLPVLDPYPETRGQGAIVDGLIPEHYYTEAHALKFIAEFVNALKKYEVYDNTRIVVVSDHDWGDSWQLNLNPDWKILNIDNWPNALLMFKDFNSHGALKISEALMSNEDVPALLIDGIDKAEGIYTLDELLKLSTSERIRINVAHPHDAQLTSTLFCPDGGVYQVKGSLFKPENWQRIE